MAAICANFESFANAFSLSISWLIICESFQDFLDCSKFEAHSLELFFCDGHKHVYSIKIILNEFCSMFCEVQYSKKFLHFLLGACLGSYSLWLQPRSLRLPAIISRRFEYFHVLSSEATGLLVLPAFEVDQ